MSTAVKSKLDALRVPSNLPEVEYPAEVIERWDREFEIAKLQLATGEIVPKTAAEMAADWGIRLE